MHSWLSASLLLALSAVATAQDSTTITITPSNDTSTISTGSIEQLVVALNRTGDLSIFANIMALSNTSTNGFPSAGYIADSLFLATSTSLLQITNSDIAFISCDPTNYQGNIQATDVFAEAIQNEAPAVLFYSTTGTWCNLSAPGSTYNQVYSMTSMNDSQSLSNLMQNNTKSSPNHIPAALGLETAIQELIHNGTTSPGGISGGGQDGQQNSNNLGPSPSTAVAMIILYSITGLITALFLIIIITGAVRAHRHPERYGPRNILGRPRQSRAKGLARAMLEGLPIVKFGEEEPAKPADVELAEHGTAETIATVSEGGIGSKEVGAKDEVAPRLSTSAQSGIGPATEGRTASDAAAAKKDDHLGCSICTDDFEQGQDLRVLPCNHKFHPACIDPWLLNVSGTCPLCRINLNPATEEDSEAREGEENAMGDLPPPLPDAGARPSVGRSLLMGLRNVAGPHGATEQDRIIAIMRMRQERVEQSQRDSAARREALAAASARTGQTAVDESHRRRRFRDVFGIRTRTRGAAGQDTEATAPTTDTIAEEASPFAVNASSTISPERETALHEGD